MLLMLIFSNYLALTSNSWMTLWISLEMNLLMFIPIIIKKINSIKIEMAMKYYLMQTLSSLLMINTMIEMNYKNYKLFILNLIMIMKMGLSPFHKWLINMIYNINWHTLKFLMTIQKIIPMWILSMFWNFSFTMKFIISINLMMSTLGGWNQTSLQKFIFFSSMNHSSWIMSSFIINKTWWMNYLLMYSIILMSMTYYFQFYKIFSFNQIFSLNINKWMILIFLINLFSLMGMPPFMGFIPKWYLMKLLMNNVLLILLLIFTTMLTFYFYSTLMLLTMINNYKINYKLKFKNTNIILIMSMIPNLWLFI
uniref:NADH dehydrogenase subunit 2 n=1 Tax=Dipterophagus daci TaxID=2800156 RepID=UPI001D10ADFA|nr:NADH dehydrogenase subunit 2 [Dipterophagus daci]QZO77412.1 NADH dehydrogenase subunit 2 [Dipterophagus daci]